MITTATATEDGGFWELVVRYQKLLREFVQNVVPESRKEEMLSRLDSMEEFDPSSTAFKFNEKLYDALLKKNVEIVSFQELKGLGNLLSGEVNPCHQVELCSILGLELTTGEKQFLAQRLVHRHLGWMIAPPTMIEDGVDLDTPDWMYQDPETLVSDI